MLEEILKNINSNLERIAKSQEELLNYTKEPVTITAADVQEAVKVINKAENKSVPVQKTENAQVSAPVTAQVQNTIPQGILQPQVQQQIAQPIPTTQVTESFTQEQLAVAMSRAVSAGKMSVIQSILQSFGVQALTQINQADYNKVATMLKEAGVEV